METPTESGINEMIEASLSNETLPGLKIEYGEDVMPSGGGRLLRLNIDRSLAYIRADHYNTRNGQGENVAGPHAPLITLAHELGHALLNLGEYGAVTFFENQYRSAFGIPRRRTYDGIYLEQLGEVESDTENYLEWAGHYKKFINN